MIKNITRRHQLTIKMRFILILGTLIIGFSLFGIATFKAMTTLNVNGPVYQRIAQGKDVIATSCLRPNTSSSPTWLRCN